jgi:hypothetical protein
MATYYTSDRKDEIALEVDQPMAWTNASGSELYLDGKREVVEGAVSGNLIKLKLASASAANTITYFVDGNWEPKTLLYGQNGVAALTFCEVPIEALGHEDIEQGKL